MKKTARLNVLMMALVCVWALSGCATVNIDAGVDEAYCAFLRYHITADLSDMSDEDADRSVSAMNRLVKYYELSLGFTVDNAAQNDKNAIDVTMALQKPCGSYEEAFVALKEMLCDPAMTPFMHVNMEHVSTEFEQAFVFSANTDLSQILGAASVMSLPMDLRRDIKGGLSALTGEVSVTLPASEVTAGSENAVPPDGQSGVLRTVKTALKTEAPTTLQMSTRLSIEGGAAVPQPIGEIIAAYQNNVSVYAAILIGAAVLLIAAAVTLAVMRKKRHRR